MIAFSRFLSPFASLSASRDSIAATKAYRFQIMPIPGKFLNKRTNFTITEIKCAHKSKLRALKHH
jgi:hypothetical protein